MDPALKRQPVSSELPAFRELLARHLSRGEVLVVLLRYANCGGDRDYFVARSPAELAAALKLARPKTSITAFFEEGFKVRGSANDQLYGDAITMLSSLDDECVGLVRVDTRRIDFADESSEITDWFAKHRGAPILVGPMAFWEDNCAEVVTAYVPDPDGNVRPGAY